MFKFKKYFLIFSIILFVSTSYSMDIESKTNLSEEFQTILFDGFEYIILKLNNGKNNVFNDFFNFIDRYIIEFDYFDDVGLNKNKLDRDKWLFFKRLLICLISNVRQDVRYKLLRYAIKNNRDIKSIKFLILSGARENSGFFAPYENTYFKVYPEESLLSTYDIFSSDLANTSEYTNRTQYEKVFTYELEFSNWYPAFKVNRDRWPLLVGLILSKVKKGFELFYKLDICRDKEKFISTIDIENTYDLDEDLIKYLLENVVDVNTKDFMGNTAIFYALLFNVPSNIVKMLINYGAIVSEELIRFAKLKYRRYFKIKKILPQAYKRQQKQRNEVMRRLPILNISN